MAAVWQLDVPALDKLVLLKLADHADDAGENAYPSIATIAHWTGVSERSVQSVLKRQRKTGLLEVQQPARHQQPTTYRFNLARGAHRAPLTRPEVHSVYPSGVQMEASGVQMTTFRGAKALHPNHPEPSFEPSIRERAQKSRAPAPSARSPFSENKFGKTKSPVYIHDICTHTPQCKGFTEHERRNGGTA